MSSTKPLPPSTRKRLVSSSQNSSFFMDPEVNEIPPPIPCSFKSNKKKQDVHSSGIMILDERGVVRNKRKAIKGSASGGVYSAFHAQDFVAKSHGSINKVEASKHSTTTTTTQESHNKYNLDCDLAAAAYDDDFSSGIMILDERGVVRNKGKAIKGSYGGVYSAFHAQDFVAKSHGSISKVEASKHSTTTQESHNTCNLDCDLAAAAYDDDFSNYYLSDFMDVDEYAMLQAHFDSVDIPAGVEADIPWFPDFSEGKKNTTQLSLNGNDQSHLSKKPASVSSSSFQTSVNPLGHSLEGGVVPKSLLFPQGSKSKKSATSQLKSSSQNLSGWKSFHPYQGSGSTNGSIWSHSDSTMLPHAVNPTYWDHHFSSAAKKQTGAGSYMHSSIPSPIDGLNHTMDALHQTMETESAMSWWPHPMKPKYNFNKHNIYSSFHDPVDGAYVTPQEVADIRKQSNVNEEHILSMFQHFKRFDTVEDFSDHHYASSGSSTKQPQKIWAKKIQDEWRMLEKDLPDTIFVRVYESRMDLLRAVIIGVEGTPYHDGLFFFDVFFPANYPQGPPHVHYHSGGLRLNPNLYYCGKVCLSLLNTWSGNKNERWIPGMSTMLQVLVSIQALILNQDPYFNEPGWAHHKGSPQGDKLSQQYNEDTFILSLKTMVYSMRRPPKHFEDFVVGHFYRRAHDILVACKAYMDGAQVGCLVKGGIQDVDEGDLSCSQTFKDSVAGCVNMLVKEFAKLGVKDCEKFLVVPKCRNNGRVVIS